MLVIVKMFIATKMTTFLESSPHKLLLQFVFFVYPEEKRGYNKKRSNNKVAYSLLLRHCKFKLRCHQF